MGSEPNVGLATYAKAEIQDAVLEAGHLALLWILSQVQYAGELYHQGQACVPVVRELRLWDDQGNQLYCLN